MSKIKIFGLGGLSESGKNSYVIEVDDEIFVFDAGIKFASGNLLGIDYIMPDFSYLVKNKKNRYRIIGWLFFFVRWINETNGERN